MKFQKKFLAFLCAGVLWVGLGAILLQSAAAKKEENFSVKKNSDAFSRVFFLIQNSYFEGVKPSLLWTGAMNGMLKTLDPYSQFLDAKTYQDLKSDTRGLFGGIGLEVSVKGGILHVISPLDDSPADRAGLRPGDVILKIDGVATKDTTLADAVRKMRGKPGEIVTLRVMRDGEKEAVEIPVKREVVKVSGVRAAKMLSGSVGYIRIAEFQEQTAKDFKQELSALQKNGMSGLIIDVRNNPGGLLTAAVEVAENFIGRDQLIVETKGRMAKKNKRYLSGNPKPLKITPLLVLVNKGSASASEILAGALQDTGLAMLLGSKTYGKGCVQTLTPLSDGTAVRITTSRYYTPKGRSIHEIGILPDVVVSDEPKNLKDIALERALDLMQGTPQRSS